MEKNKYEGGDYLLLSTNGEIHMCRVRWYRYGRYSIKVLYSCGGNKYYKGTFRIHSDVIDDPFAALTVQKIDIKKYFAILYT